MVERWGEAPALTRDNTLPADGEVKAITPPKKKAGYVIWLIAAGIILLAILVIIDSSNCSPILRFKDANYYHRAGECYFSQINLEKSITAYENGLKLEPDSRILREELADSHNELAWTLAYHLDTDYERALVHALRAVELESNCHYQDTLGLVYYKLGKYADALVAYSQALALDGHDCVDSLKSRGDVFRATGQDQLALADYRRYLYLKPKALDREAVEEIIQTLQ